MEILFAPETEPKPLPHLSKVKPFKHQPDVEVDDQLVPHPVVGKSYSLPAYALLSDVLKSQSFRDEFTGRVYDVNVWEDRYIKPLPNGGTYVDRDLNLKVVDYENFNFADWVVDPSRETKLPTVSKPSEPEPESLSLATISAIYIPFP